MNSPMRGIRQENAGTVGRVSHETNRLPPETQTFNGSLRQSAGACRSNNGQRCVTGRHGPSRTGSTCHSCLRHARDGTPTAPHRWSLLILTRRFAYRALSWKPSQGPQSHLTNSPIACVTPPPLTPGEGAPFLAMPPSSPIASGMVIPPAFAPARARCCAICL